MNVTVRYTVRRDDLVCVIARYLSEYDAKALTKKHVETLLKNHYLANGLSVTPAPDPGAVWQRADELATIWFPEVY